MITRENFKKEFVNLVEEGKIEVDKALDKAKKELDINYIAHHGIYSLDKFLNAEWKKRVDELFSFIEDKFKLNSLGEQKFIDQVKKEYGYCEDFFDADIKKYFENIIKEHFKEKKIKKTGWDGRIL